MTLCIVPIARKSHMAGFLVESHIMLLTVRGRDTFSVFSEVRNGFLSCW